MQYLPTGDVAVFMFFYAKHSMSGGFKWEENVQEFTEDFINSLSDEESRGFMLEVDLEYPSSLHDTHDQYPLGERC